MLLRAPLHAALCVAAGKPSRAVERAAGVVGSTRLRACRAALRVALSGRLNACPRSLALLARQAPLAATRLHAPRQRQHARRGAAAARASKDPAGDEPVRLACLSSRRSVLSSHLQMPINYQAVALTVGSAFAFGAGIYAFKGGDSVRQACVSAVVLLPPLTPSAPSHRRPSSLRGTCSSSRCPSTTFLCLCCSLATSRRGSSRFCYTKNVLSAFYDRRCPRRTRQRCWSTASWVQLACAPSSLVCALSFESPT